MTLLERLEAASEGSRELDVAIAEEALGLIVEQVDCVNDTSPIREYSVKALHSNVWRNLPYYTTSLDAALTLVPEGWSWAASSTAIKDSDMLHEAQVNWEPSVQAATPALALTIACLKAREAQQTDKDE